MKERGDYEGTDTNNKSLIRQYVEKSKTHDQCLADTVYCVRKKGSLLNG